MRLGRRHIGRGQPVLPVSGEELADPGHGPLAVILGSRAVRPGGELVGREGRGGGPDLYSLMVGKECTLGWPATSLTVASILATRWEGNWVPSSSQTAGISQCVVVRLEVGHLS